MNTLFDEREADKEVIDSLLKTNGTLWRELEASRSMVKLLAEQLKRRQEPMSKILQDHEGRLYIAHKIEALTEGVAKELVGIFEQDLSQLRTFLSNVADGSVTPATPDQTSVAGNDNMATAQNDQTTQTQPAVPADPNATPAAPADQTQAAPVNPDVQVAPVDQPAPAPQALAPDLNLAQSEQPVMPPLQ
jgi:TolA-binding protein